MWANSLSKSVSPWLDARRAASINISAAKPLFYSLKGSMHATKAARQTGLERATLYRKIRARDHCMSPWRTIWSRFCDDRSC